MSTSRATIGDYVVTSKLGSGSFAMVYKGYHKITKVPVAIKAMSLSKLNSKLLGNLETEIAIMRQIDHPNVVKLYEIKKTEKHMYLILEYCAGGDLQQFIRRHGKQFGTSIISEDIVHHFVHELAQGMHCLWSNHLIHRDLKPQNLLLLEDSCTSVLKIADFGFARHLATTSMAETLCGSPLYMAPEILKFQKYDAKADLWSVGTIIYEMVSGKPPFSGANHIQLLSNIERKELSFPNDIVISDSCKELLIGLLRRRPIHRMGFEEFFSHPFVNLELNEQEKGIERSSRMASSIQEEEEDAEAGDEDEVEQDKVKKNEPETSPAYGGTMRSSRSGNMEVMQTVFSSTSTSTNSMLMRRSHASRLGKSRTRASSSGMLAAEVDGQRSKLSPQMSPDVLPTPSPRINPFKELLSTNDSPPFPPKAQDTPVSIPPRLVRAQTTTPRTHATLVRQKNSTSGSVPALDSSGEYVLVDSGSDKGGSGQSSRRNTPRGRTSTTSSSPIESGTTPLGRVDVQNPSSSIFSHEYAQHLVEIVSLRSQAIAPIADHLWQLSTNVRNSAPSQDVSISSMTSSVSSSTGRPSLQGSGMGISASENRPSEEHLDPQEYIYAAEALALYVKCMGMIQHALLYLRQDPVLARGSPSSKSPTQPGSVHWTQAASRKHSMLYLAEQLNALLELAEKCKKRMTAYETMEADSQKDWMHALSQEELLYTHAIRLGKEGAIKEVLGHSRSAYELYLQAMLLLESLLMNDDCREGPGHREMTVEDQKRVTVLVQSLEERLYVVQHKIDTKPGSEIGIDPSTIPSLQMAP